MDDQTPEMEQLSAQMREAMQLWIENPDNGELKAHYSDLQARYQRMYVAYKKGQTDGVA